MSAFDDLPVAADPDPIGADDPTVLRTEILRLRDGLLGANGRAEVLRDRIAELEAPTQRELDAANLALHEQLAPKSARPTCAARAVRRRLTGPS